MNSNIKQFYDALVQLINNCGLPVGTAYFILKDLTNELQRGYEQAAADESNQTPKTHAKTIEVTPQVQEEEKEDGSNTVTENL